MSLEQFLASISEEDLKRLNEEYYKIKNKKPTYLYSKIRDKDLDNLVDIEKKIRSNHFEKWFDSNVEISSELIDFFQELIDNNIELIDEYSEEDLKVNVIIPILNKVKFKSFEKEFRDFYELPLRYETQNFIFKGTTDFVVSKGLVKSKKPYFFIQEFKRSEEYGNPRPQLLAELISGVELNQWNEIKGAYIIGALWYFVILKKLDTNKYEYFVSQGFNSMNIEELKTIYKNLLYIKNEIIEKENN